MIQPETRWIRDSLVPNTTHLGNNLEPAANQYPKGLWSKDPARMTERRVPMVNQGPTSTTEWRFVSAVNSQTLIERDKENGITGIWTIWEYWRPSIFHGKKV